MKPMGFTHELQVDGKTNDWITPKHIIDAFGIGWFDLDPCASENQPWPCALKSYTIRQNGLKQSWEGNVWLNPPYGSQTSTWIRRMIEHGNGVAMVFARTETELWQDQIFPTASGFLFLRGRVRFYCPNGSASNWGKATAPSCLIAWGGKNFDKLVGIAKKGLICGSCFGRSLSLKEQPSYYIPVFSGNTTWEQKYG
jgi:hypothetical protein